MDFATALQQLRKTTAQVHPLKDNVWNAFSAIWQPVTAKRKTALTNAGETEKYLYFVTHGIQRAYAVTEDGREATLVFMYPFSFAGIIDSFLLQTPSRYCFETLTQSELLRTTFRQIDELMKQHHSFETLMRKSMSHVIAGLLERQIELQCFSAEQKFTTLMKRSPHILNMIPHKYLASYLGLDATTFSKLLGSVRI